MVPATLSIALSQHSSCSYQPDMSSMLCKCKDHEDGDKIVNLDKDILTRDNVTIESCASLSLSMDLSGVTTATISILVKNCGNVEIVNIKQDPASHGLQVVDIQLQNLDTFTMQDLHIEDEIMISSWNVSEVFLYQNVFSSLPANGLRMETADKVSIIDCVFNNTAPGSISVDTVKEVKIVNNQFSIDAIEVMVMRDSHNLYISCNRIIGEPVNVECAKISSAMQSVSLKSFSPDSIMPSYASSASMDVKSEKQNSTIMDILLWVLVTLGLIIVALVIICFCCRRRHKEKVGDVEIEFKDQVETEKLVPNQYEEKEDLDFKANMLPEDIDKKNITDVASVVTSDDTAGDIIEKVKQQETILKREIEGAKVQSL